MISGDKDKTKTYCDIVKLDDLVDQAEQRGGSTDLNQELNELAEKLGPEYEALMARFRDIDLNIKAGMETAVTMQTTIDELNKLCGSAARRPGRD